MKLPLITTLVIAISFLTITIVEAKIYTWKDASGQMHYSATPPKPTEKISNLKDDLQITDNSSIALLSKKKPLSFVKKEKPERINGSDDKSKIKTTHTRNLCRSQRRNLSLLEKNRKVNWVKGGKSKRLNSEQRKDQIRILEDSIRMDCSFGGERKDRKPIAKKSNKDD